MERKQFTFYGSFFRAMRKIKSKIARADIYDSICAYALFEEVPDEDNIHPTALAIFEMARPVLDTAKEKALAGAEGGKKRKASKPEADTKQMESEKEKEKEKENEIECESKRARERFEIFWKEFPKKTDKQRAWVVFQSVDVEMDVLLEGLRRQKLSEQWLEQGGRFVPRATDWLRDRRWEDQLPEAGKKVPMGATGQLGEVELMAIRKMMEE